MKTKTTFIAMLLALFVTTTTPAAMSQNYSPRTLEEAINNPEIKDSKLKSDIVVQQNHIAKSIYENNHNLIVSPTRNEEVILVTIPADQLFAPNETEMIDGAAGILEKFTPLMSRPDYYRIALAMYHDDNGGETYSEQITQQRLQSIVNWFMANTNNNKYISYFAMGNRNPIYPMNDSMQHRRLNRRLEIYIIPGEAMIQQSKNDKKNKKNKKK